MSSVSIGIEMFKKLMTIIGMVKLRFKKHTYVKVAEEEKSLEIDDAIEQARESMHTLRELLIRIYEREPNSTNN